MLTQMICSSTQTDNDKHEEKRLNKTEVSLDQYLHSLLVYTHNTSYCPMALQPNRFFSFIQGPTFEHMNHTVVSANFHMVVT